MYILMLCCYLNISLCSGNYKIQEWNEDAETYFDQTAWSYGMHVQVVDPIGKEQLSRVTVQLLACQSCLCLMIAFELIFLFVLVAVADLYDLLSQQSCMLLFRFSSSTCNTLFTK